jgi:hypothetical protein
VSPAVPAYGWVSSYRMSRRLRAVTSDTWGRTRNSSRIAHSVQEAVVVVADMGPCSGYAVTSETLLCVLYDRSICVAPNHLYVRMWSRDTSNVCTPQEMNKCHLFPKCAPRFKITRRCSILEYGVILETHRFPSRLPPLPGAI